MHRSILWRMLLVVVSVGWWSGFGITESQGQTCQNNFICTTNPNTVSANFATVGGGGNNSASGSSATVGGGAFNTASGSFATVSGGVLNDASGDYATVGGGDTNTANGGSATVAGGASNTASGSAATVGGGFGNSSQATRATVGGGQENTASQTYATVGGGLGNAAGGLSTTVGGGRSNTANGSNATVGGGWNNTASGSHTMVGGGLANGALGFAAAIPGGYLNAAGGNFSFAAGRQAKARHKGAFVWADATAADFASTIINQFNVRASGGTRIFSNATATVGVRLAPGSNAWSIASDQALKEDFHDIDKQQVLANVQQLTIQNWKLKDEAGNVRHVGPVAQDFHAAFKLGGDEHYLHSGDVDGIALVAIQALAERSEALAERNQALEQHVEALQQQLSQVLHQVQALVQEREREPVQQVANTAVRRAGR